MHLRLQGMISLVIVEIETWVTRDDQNIKDLNVRRKKRSVNIDEEVEDGTCPDVTRPVRRVITDQKPSKGGLRRVPSHWTHRNRHGI